MGNQNRAFVAIVLVLAVGAGVAAAGSQGGVSAFGVPLFALGVILAFVIQWVAFIPAFLLKTEKFYDLTGSITYLSVIAAALFLNPAVDSRGWLLAGMVAVWAVRLGTFCSGAFWQREKTGASVRLKSLLPVFCFIGPCKGSG